MKLGRACREFESLLLTHLLKSMRQTTAAMGEREQATGSGIMTEMMDEQMARLLAKGGGLGLANMLEAKLQERDSGASIEGKPVPLSGRPVVLTDGGTRGLGRPSEAYSTGEAEAKRLVPYGDIIGRAAREFNLRPALLRAVIAVESGGEPETVSSKGARGLMQLMDETARELGVVDAFDPEQNIFAGARYLREQMDRWDGDLRRALAAYNAGPQAVERYDGVPPFPETRSYVRRVVDLMYSPGMATDSTSDNRG
jgi:Rod binding domain-containing protein